MIRLSIYNCVGDFDIQMIQFWTNFTYAHSFTLLQGICICRIHILWVIYVSWSRFSLRMCCEIVVVKKLMVQLFPKKNSDGSSRRIDRFINIHYNTYGHDLQNAWILAQTQLGNIFPQNHDQ